MQPKFKYFVLIISLMLICAGCNKVTQSEKMLDHFIDRHVEKIKPIERKYNEAAWVAYSGKGSFSDLLKESKKADSLYRNMGESPEYYQTLLNNVYDNSSDFEMLKKLREADLIEDPLLRKQLEVLFMHYLDVNSENEEAKQLQTRILDRFYNLKRNEQGIIDSLRQTDAHNIRNKWIEHFAVLTEDFRSLLVALNKYAGQFGFNNYYEMVLNRNQIDYLAVEDYVQMIKVKTGNDYKQLIKLTEQDICTWYNITPGEISPAHYSRAINRFLIPESWQKEYEKDSLIDIVEQYFAIGNFEPGNLDRQSDIWYEKEKINQAFFFCADADKHDYRIYANVKPNTQGLYILLHELGHLVHFKYVDNSIPYLLREPNIISTEAIAGYFTNKLHNSPTLRSMAGLPDNHITEYYPELKNPYQLYMLRFLARNTMFEKKAFENPEQDFNKLWWDLTEEYMLFRYNKDKDIPEWVTSRHLIYASGVNATYLYASGIAAQLEHYFPDKNMQSLCEFMKYGNALSWEELLLTTTGENLNIDYLIDSTN
ncbi:MAG: hypothetical protein PF436_14250 [Prolixibacteraceae bacterium]|jgi:peptidyl-dipeptidase A|nr:hypothetical protein [Prolixibacteraceae bacterium]